MNTLAEKLALRNAQIEKLSKLKVKKTVSRTERKLGKENSFVLAIYNAGADGLTFKQMLAENKKRENKTSEITINHNWNTFSYIQRGEMKLRAPWEVNTTYIALKKKFDEIENSELTEIEGKTAEMLAAEMQEIEVSNPAKCEAYFDVEFDFDVNNKNLKNNKITLFEESRESVKAYLLTVGAKNEMFETFEEVEIAEVEKPKATVKPKAKVKVKK